MRGFTFIEMVATLAIIAILTTICVPLAEVSSQRRKEEDLRVALRQIRDALDAHRKAADEGRIKRAAGESGYPPNLKVLADGVEDAQNPAGGRLYFLRRLPRDPTFPDANRPADQTWGKRSYASAPNAPKEGKDVFDVYSLSEGKGLNGVPYGEW
jgi:general secretion pathway protein G